MVSRSDDHDYPDRLDRRDREDWRENRQHHERNQIYRRLASLRDAGYDEVVFSKDNPAHCDELKGIVAQLQFHRMDYEIVTIQEASVDILFLTSEAAELLDIETRRNEMEGILRDGQF